MILPEDVFFAMTFHRSSLAGIPDPTASGWRRTAGTSLSRIYGSGVVRSLCRGASTTVEFSVGNVGGANVSSSAPLAYRVVLSSNDSISVADTSLASGTFWANVGGWTTKTSTITVPNNAIPGQTYWVGVMVDPLEVYSEEDENNNSTKTGLKITVKNSGC
jgi:hypothetical protein